MTLNHAQRIAAIVTQRLSPYCSKIAIAGSIARLKPDNIKDIEIVCIPKTMPSGLFDQERVRHPGFVKTVNKWMKLKGDAATGKSIQRVFSIDFPSVPEKSIKLDIFIATPDNWGNTLVIRTGPAEYSQAIMAHINSLPGYQHKDNYLWIDDVKQSIPTEEAFFEAIKMPFLPPNMRK